MQIAELAKLEALAGHLSAGGDRPELFLFARSGFERQLLEAARDDPRLHLVAPAEM